MSLVMIKNLCSASFLSSRFLFYQQKYISIEHATSDQIHFCFHSYHSCHKNFQHNQNKYLIVLKSAENLPVLQTRKVAIITLFICL